MCRSGEVPPASDFSVGVEVVEVDWSARRGALKARTADEVLSNPAFAVTTPDLDPTSFAVDHPDLADAWQQLVINQLAAEILGARRRRQYLHDEYWIVDLASDRF